MARRKTAVLYAITAGDALMTLRADPFQGSRSPDFEAGASAQLVRKCFWMLRGVFERDWSPDPAETAAEMLSEVAPVLPGKTESKHYPAGLDLAQGERLCRDYDPYLVLRCDVEQNCLYVGTKQSLLDTDLALPLENAKLPREVAHDVFGDAKAIGYGLGTDEASLRRVFVEPWACIQELIREPNRLQRMCLFTEAVARDSLAQTCWVETEEQAKRMRDDEYYFRPKLDSRYPIGACFQVNGSKEQTRWLFFRLGPDGAAYLVTGVPGLEEEAERIDSEETGRDAIVDFIRRNYGLERADKRMAKMARAIGMFSALQEQRKDGPAAAVVLWYILRLIGKSGDPVFHLGMPGLRANELRKTMASCYSHFPNLRDVPNEMSEGILVRYPSGWEAKSPQNVGYFLSGFWTGPQKAFMDHVDERIQDAISVNQMGYLLKPFSTVLSVVLYQQDGAGEMGLAELDSGSVISLNELAAMWENGAELYSRVEDAVDALCQHTGRIPVAAQHLERQMPFQRDADVKRSRASLLNQSLCGLHTGLEHLTIPGGWTCTLAKFRDGSVGVACGPVLAGETVDEAKERLYRESCAQDATNALLTLT